MSKSVKESLGVPHWWVDMMHSCWPDNQMEPDLVELIAKSNGWHGLVLGEDMEVGFHGKRYVITRIK